MMRIRKIEEYIAKEYPKGEMRCPTHLSIGQEAVAVATSSSIYSTDFAVSTHRGHAHYLAKGGNLKSMISEIFGKATGCSEGKGGSMHLIDKKVNFMGTSAIVGNSIPIGVGLALSATIKKSGQISIVYLGDGAVEEGVFYESINFAVLRNLPVLFICENNLYSVYSPLSVRQPKGRKISEMVNGMGCSSAASDGNNVELSYQLISSKINTIRNNCGPVFLEFATYRHREHCGHNFDDDLGYRKIGESNYWFSRDPIELQKQNLINENLITNDTIKNFEKKISNEITEAFDFARKSPYPEVKESFKGVYK